MTTSKSEPDLVQAAKQGDKTAFGQLIARHSAPVQLIIQRMSADRLYDHDLFQEAILQAYLHLDTLRESDKFRAWLCGITRNVCLMHLRTQNIQSIPFEMLEEVGGSLPAHTPSPEELVERLELRQHLEKALRLLSDANREAILLFYYEGFDLRETAQRLAISSDAVKGRLHRARKHLKTLLTTFDVLTEVTEGEQVMIPVKVVDVVMRSLPVQDDAAPRRHYEVVLMDEVQRRAVVIWVGEYEGLAIALKLNNSALGARPMTQTFMARLVEASGAALERVEISALRGQVYYATVQLRADGQLRQVDARPSDAISLALHTDTPLYISEAVMAEVGIAVSPDQTPNRTGLRAIQNWLDDLAQAEAAHRQRVSDDPEYQYQQQAAQVIREVFTSTEH